MGRRRDAARVPQARNGGAARSDKNFGERNIRTGEPITLLQERFVPVYFMHRFALNGTSKAIGGMEYSNAVRGDAQQATRPVGYQQQMDALRAMLDALRPEELAIPDTVLTLDGARRDQRHAASRAVRAARRVRRSTSWARRSRWLR